MANQNLSYSKTYKEIIPYEDYGMFDVAWHEGMSAGNGHIGVIESGVPLNTNEIFQNVEFVMPSKEPRCNPEELKEQLDEARQSVMRMDDTWDIHKRKRTNMYCHHPAYNLRIEMLKVAKDADRKSLSDEITITDYERFTDYERAELVVKFKADGKEVVRKTFVSQTDDVIITEISGIEGFGIKLVIEDFESIHKFGVGKNGAAMPERDMKYSRFIQDNIIGFAAHYPSYKGSELAKGGFAGITKVITDEGRIMTFDRMKCDMACTCVDDASPVLKITDTNKIILITYTDWAYDCGELEDFKSIRNCDIRTFPIIAKCVEKVDDVIYKYQEQDLYNKAISKHLDISKERYNRVKLDLGNSEKETNEQLLERQKKETDIIPELLERIYNNGRYGLLSNSGYTAPRLNGIGVGEWNLSWRNAYTMDANVNIQVSGINSGNMYEAGVGYIWFVLRQIKDWENNAFYVYGMKDALLTPVNTDGHRAMMVEYDINYPFQYWNTGASWMLLPIVEFVDCFGDTVIKTEDKEIIKMYNKDTFDVKNDVLMPLLCKTYNFWKQICTPEYYTDKDGNARYTKGKKCLEEGERYLIIPSFSPENKPLGYKSAITANAAMDISAAKDIITMYIHLQEELKKSGYEEKVSEAKDLLDKLPVFEFAESGAIREWSMKEYKENNEHRHISHLYCAWPAYQAQHNEKLAAACRQAIIDRNRENTGKDDTASHGWIHKALVEARLKNKESVYDILNLLIHSDIFYTSLYTDHNTNRAKGVACTDTLYGINGIINEMLVYSDTNTVELIPALSKKIPKGNIRGLMTRAGIKVEELSWDTENKKVAAQLYALRDTKVCLRCNNDDFGQSYKKEIQLKEGDRFVY